MMDSAWTGKAKSSGASWRRSSSFLLTGTGLLLLGLLSGFYLFFPAETLKQRIIQEVTTRTGIEVQIGQMSLYPLLTLDADQTRLGLPGLPQPLEIEWLSVAPQWSTLLTGDPGVQLQGNLMEGTFSAGLLKSGAINAAATGLRFNLPLQSPLSYNLAGTLREATIDAATRLDPETKTHLVLQLDEVRLLGLEMLNADNPGLALGTINLAADGKGRTIKVTTLTAQGGDLEVSAEGTVLIGRTSATSRIRLTLQVRPGSNADPSITSLLTLAGQPDAEGRYTLQLTGTLAKPNLKSGG